MTLSTATYQKRLTYSKMYKIANFAMQKSLSMSLKAYVVRKEISY
jgi:hypothetical protein